MHCEGSNPGFSARLGKHTILTSMPSVIISLVISALGTSKQLRQCDVYTGALERPVFNGHWAYFRFSELFFFFLSFHIHTHLRKLLGHEANLTPQVLWLHRAGSPCCPLNGEEGKVQHQGYRWQIRASRRVHCGGKRWVLSQELQCCPLERGAGLFAKWTFSSQNNKKSRP